MRKTVGIGLVLVFALSFAFGALVTPADAKPPIPCEYRCINQDWYLCCLYPIGEICTFVSYVCEYPPGG